MTVTVDQLVRIANDISEDEEVRVAATEGLGYVVSQLGRPVARRALSEMVDDLQQIHPVRVAAARALGRLA